MRYRDSGRCLTRLDFILVGHDCVLKFIQGTCTRIDITDGDLQSQSKTLVNGVHLEITKRYPDFKKSKHIQWCSAVINWI